MDTSNIKAMSEHYRKIRIAVYKQATLPLDGSQKKQETNKKKLKDKFFDICNGANLSKYKGSDLLTAQQIWYHLWTKNRYAGIMSKIASKEIDDIKFIFNDYESFSRPSWDIETLGNNLIRAGIDTQHFLRRTGPFASCQTIGNLPKLCKIVYIARKLKGFLDNKAPDLPVLNFITNGLPINGIWDIHKHIMDIGYTKDLTALHFMMDIGFQVIKPDIVITRLFLDWGWLHLIIARLPTDLAQEDIECKKKGKYGGKFKYTNPFIYKPVIELARQIVASTDKSDLINDIGWVTNNTLREFDLFVVKYGQEPEEDFGLTRCLAKNIGSFTPFKKQCPTVSLDS